MIPDPWPLLGWALLVVLALVWLGGVIELWWSALAGRPRIPAGRLLVGMVLALTWPFAVGCTVIREIEGRA